MLVVERMTHEQRRDRRRQMAEAAESGEAIDQIARRFEVGISTVQNALAEHGVSKRKLNRANRAGIASLCENKKAIDVAVEVGCSYATVLNSCKEFGVQLKSGRPGQVTNEIVSREEWNSADWSLRDIEIATELGVTRERVRQVRKILRKEKSPGHRCSQVMICARKWLIENRDKVSGHSIYDIRELCPHRASVDGFKRLCNNLGIPFITRQKRGSGITQDNIKDFCQIVPCKVMKSECWEWKYSKRKTGYGFVGSIRYLHRFAYTLFNGAVPDGMWVLHKCDNPRCVNPDHLYAGTPTDNAHDRAVRGRNGNATLLPEQVKQIREMYAMGGVTMKKLADRFGVSVHTVNRIIQGDGWKHLDEQLKWREAQRAATQSAK